MHTENNGTEVGITQLDSLGGPRRGINQCSFYDSIIGDQTIRFIHINRINTSTIKVEEVPQEGEVEVQ